MDISNEDQSDEDLKGPETNVSAPHVVSVKGNKDSCHSKLDGEAQMVNSTTASAQRVARANIQLGVEYDILDSSKRWCEGKVQDTLAVTFISFHHYTPLLGDKGRHQ